MRRRRSDDALTPIIGFIIATVLFTVTFYFIAQTAVERDADTTAAANTSFSAIAGSLADVVIDPGSGWYSTTACVAGTRNEAAWAPDGIASGRFGLGDEGCPYSRADPRTVNNVSYDKFQNLNQAYENADGANTFVDYDEARESLGLADRNIDFHLRSWPVLLSVRESLAQNYLDPFLKPLYLGDYEEAVAGSVPRPTLSLAGTFQTDQTFGYLNLTIQNTGIVASALTVDFSVSLSGGTLGWAKNVYELPGGSSTVARGVLRKSSDWNWGSSPAQYGWIVSDPIGPLYTGQVALGAGYNMANPTPAGNQIVTTLSMDRLIYELPFAGSNKDPVASYVGQKGTGAKVNNFGQNSADVEMKLIGPGGATTIIANPERNGQSLTGLGVGQYTVQLWVPSIATGVMQSEATFEVLPVGSQECNIQPGDFAPQSSAAVESRFVDLLFEKYDHGASTFDYGHASLPYLVGGVGDVYPDVKCSMNSNLPAVLLDENGDPTLERYTTMIVGSNVQHDAMTSSAAKDTIRDWVFAGGTLIVMGSSDQSVQWLQPIFHSAIDPANDPLSTPDENHPILHEPNDLDYTTFNTYTDWSYNSGSEAFFSHVRRSGDDDVLGVSLNGAFGRGKVVLSGWRPYDLTTDQATTCAEPITSVSHCQGLALIQNLVTISYYDLYLDYGPSIPDLSPSGVQTRIVSIWHPNLNQLIALQLQVYAFQG